MAVAVACVAMACGGSPPSPPPEPPPDPVDTSAPAWPIDAALTVGATGWTGARLTWSPATDDRAVAGYRIYADGQHVATASEVTADLGALDSTRTYALRVEAYDAVGNQSSGGPGAALYIGTPAPTVVAPPLPTVAGQSVYDAFGFLVEGTPPIQSGVAPGTIEPQRAVLLRGSVTDRDGQAIADVEIRVHDHPELGVTKSHPDGTYDLLINGGDDVVVELTKPGYLPLQRQVTTAWNHTATIDPVVMIGRDVAVTKVVADGAETQVARASVVEDDEGARQETLIVAPGTTAVMVMADGSEAPLSTLHVRMTEYTVGDSGPAAMPGPLPPLSRYTHAVELSVDEAEAAGAASVVFSRPVTLYVENYLDLPVGEAVPFGWYDHQTASWKAQDSGRIVKVTGVEDGRALLDLDGDGAADLPAALAALGIDDAEQSKLATLYAVDTSLWRVQTQHFSPHDLNWSGQLPNDARNPDGSPRTDAAADRPCKRSGSIVECENQILGEVIGVAGTGLSLHYQSDRALGRSAGRTIDIPLIVGEVPSQVKRVDLIISIAGQTIRRRFAPTADLSWSFVWDGKDGYERLAVGRHAARITIRYVYPIGWTRTERFGEASTATAGSPAGYSIFEAVRNFSRANRETFLESVSQVELVNFVATADNSLGGWTVSAQHQYDRSAGFLYTGYGERASVPQGMRVLPMRDFQLSSSLGGMAIGPDGSIYFTQGLAVYRRRPTGVVERIAGTASPGFGGDGGPAVDAQLQSPTVLAIGPDGSVYVVDSGNHRVRKIAPDGIITTFAGNGLAGNSGDGGPATDARIDPNQSWSLSADGFGNVYIIQAFFVRRVTPDGRIARFAGEACAQVFCDTGDGEQARRAGFGAISSVASAPDGTLHISSMTNRVVRTVDPSGVVAREFGRPGVVASGGDEGRPLDATGVPGQVRVDSRGQAYVLDYGHVFSVPFVRDEGPILRVMTPGGVVRRVVGSETCSPRATDLDPPSAFCPWDHFDVGPNDEVVSFVRLASGPAFVELKATGPYAPAAVVSRDGTERYSFDASGRHVQTRDTTTGVTTLTLDYDGARLRSLTDRDGQRVMIERPNPSTIVLVAPYGQRTTLGLDATGQLVSVTDPLGQVTRMTYAQGDLLASLADPEGGTSTFEYDGEGRLTKDTEPGGGYQALTRTQTPTGHRVVRTTALGDTTTYGSARMQNGYAGERVVEHHGSQAREVRTSNTKRSESVDGTVVEMTSGADPRFGAAAPNLHAMTMTTPGGRTSTVETKQLVTLADVNDPMSLLTMQSEVRRGGRTWTTGYDRGARRLMSRTPMGRSVTTLFDDKGRAVEVSAVGRHPRQFEYDAQGRQVSTTWGDRVWRTSYDAAGEIATSTGPDGRAAHFAYDALGRLLSTTRPDGAMARARYEEHGRRVLTTPVGRPAHTDEVVPEQRRSWYEPPTLAGMVTGRHESVADLDGRLLHTLRDGEVVSTPHYGADGSLTSMTTPVGDFSFTYAAGNLTSAAGPTGQRVAYRYDGSLLLGIDQGGVAPGAVDYDYDPQLRLALESIDGADVAYEYDNDDDVVRIGALALTRAAANGEVTSEAVGTVATSYSRSPYGELTARQTTAGAVGVFDEEMLTRDLTGRVTAWRETVAGESHHYDVVYDQLSRLTLVWKDGVPWQQYGYDANGNRTDVVDSAGLAVHATYDDQDRLLTSGAATYGYDRDGALTNKTVGAAITTYTYERDHLREVALPDGRQVRYELDPWGRRVARRLDGAVTHRWLYGAAAGPVAEVDAVGDVVTRYVYGLASWVPAYLDRGGQRYALVTDARGSVRLVVHVATGAVAQRLDYDPWGRVVSDSAPGFQPFGFGGGLYDPATGLVRLGAREYDAETGRWTSKDPTLLAAGMNVYGYCEGDPVNRVDPGGLLSWPSLEDIANGSAAFGDWALRTATFGLANPGPGLRRALDVDIVDMCSDVYRLVTQATEIADVIMLAYSVAQIGRVAAGAGAAYLERRAARALLREAEAACAGGKCPCFVAGTPVDTPEGPVAIEDVQLGTRAGPANACAGAGASACEPGAGSCADVDLSTWQEVELRMVVTDRGQPDVLTIALLRPPAWLAAVGAEVGRTITVELDELNVGGPAEVIAIRGPPATALASTVDDERCPVTGLVRHDSLDVIRVTLDSGAALEVTAHHPLYSADRDAWVAAGDLRPGERLATTARSAAVGSTVAVVSVDLTSRPRTPVWNLEILGAHQYAVGDDRVLAHNTYLYRYRNGPETATRLGRQAADAEARGFPHGASTTTSPVPGRPCGSASCADVKKHFPVVKTGRDPNHYTVVLPNPVDRATADLFNSLFK